MSNTYDEIEALKIKYLLTPYVLKNGQVIDEKKNVRKAYLKYVVNIRDLTDKEYMDYKILIGEIKSSS